MRIQGALVVTAMLVSCTQPAPPSSGADSVEFTWLSNSTWLVEIGETRLFLDAAISRLRLGPPNLADPQTLTPPPASPDTVLVGRVLEALGAARPAAHIIVGHTHSDHTIDLGPIARMTGAHIIGARTACLQAQAQGIPADRCTAVEGGEVIALAPGLEVRVVRWAHSGDPGDRLGRFVQAPKELVRPPVPDLETGGMSPGPIGGFPNGGGARAYLFTLTTTTGRIRWFVSDTGNSLTFDSVPTIGRDYFAAEGISLDGLEFVSAEGSPREWLARALEADGSDSVDLWLTYGGSAAHVRQVAEYLRPAAAIPHHWGGFSREYNAGVARPYANEALIQAMDSLGVRFIPQRQYLERYRLTIDGLERMPNTTAQSQMGLPTTFPAGRIGFDVGRPRLDRSDPILQRTENEHPLR